MNMYACIWRSSKLDDEFDEKECNDRMPRLFEWLRTLKQIGNVIACGGSGFHDISEGLPLLYAGKPRTSIRTF